MAAITAMAVVAVMGTLAFIPIYILVAAAPFIVQMESLSGFLLFDGWFPLRVPPSLGIVHAWVATIYVTTIALVFAVPLGFGIGIFASEVAPERIRAVLQPCLELLAGIPSVVYGFFGYVTIIPLFERYLNMGAGESVLAAGLIVAVMVLPFIASTSAEAFRAVSSESREAALSFGITRSYLIRRVIFVQAMPGMFAGVALGFARAIGETLAALILIGNSTIVPKMPTDRGQTLTGLLATNLGETTVGSATYHALFASAAVLLVVVMAINIAIWIFKRRLVGHGA